MPNTKILWDDELVNEYAEWYRKTQGNAEVLSNNNWWGKDLFEVWKEIKYEQPKLDYVILEMDLSNAGIGVLGSANDYEKQIKLGAKIKSVRRLSDNEVFTIGDKIDYYGQSLEINKFELNRPSYPNTVSIWAYDKVFHLGYVKKANIRQSLFTTTDGKDIYEGDEYWFVCTKWEVLHNQSAAKVALSGYFPETFRYYSTEEKANEYVLMNKPCLSMNDFRSCQNDLEYLNNNPQYNKLLELAKSK